MSKNDSSNNEKDENLPYKTDEDILWQNSDPNALNEQRVKITPQKRKAWHDVEEDLYPLPDSILKKPSDAQSRNEQKRGVDYADRKPWHDDEADLYDSKAAARVAFDLKEYKKRWEEEDEIKKERISPEYKVFSELKKAIKILRAAKHDPDHESRQLFSRKEIKLELKESRKLFKSMKKEDSPKYEVPVSNEDHMIDAAINKQKNQGEYNRSQRKTIAQTKNSEDRDFRKGIGITHKYLAAIEKAVAAEKEAVEIPHTVVVNSAKRRRRDSGYASPDRSR